MSSFFPFYFFKNRFGKYYFRCRISVDIRRKHNLKKVEIRKGLGTANRTEALRLSRELWVQLEKSEYTMKEGLFDHEQQQIEEIEGRKLLKELLISTIKSEPISTNNLAQQVADKIQQAGKKKLTTYNLQDAFELYLPIETQANVWKEDYVKKIKADIQMFIDLV